MRTKLSCFFLIGLTGCFVDAPTYDEFDAALARLDDLEAENQTLRDMLTEIKSGCVPAGSVELTLDVSGDGEALLDALDSLANCTIRAGTTVTVKIAAGDYEFDAPVTVDHPDGIRLRIEGDDADPDSVRLVFQNGTSGIVVPPGRQLGFLGGVSIVSEGESTETEPAGVNARANALVLVGNLVISGFPIGVLATDNAVFLPVDRWDSTQSVTVTGKGITAQGSGFFAYSGGVIQVRRSAVSSVDSAYVARDLGFIYAGRSLVNDVSHTYFADTMGFLAGAGGSEVDSCCDHPIYARYGGSIYLDNPTIPDTFSGDLYPQGTQTNVWGTYWDP